MPDKVFRARMKASPEQGRANLNATFERTVLDRAPIHTHLELRDPSEVLLVDILRAYEEALATGAEPRKMVREFMPKRAEPGQGSNQVCVPVDVEKGLLGTQQRDGRGSEVECALGHEPVVGKECGNSAIGVAVSRHDLVQGVPPRLAILIEQVSACRETRRIARRRNAEAELVCQRRAGGARGHVVVHESADPGRVDSCAPVQRPSAKDCQITGSGRTAVCRRR